MDGRTRNAGAVAGVSTTRNPVSLARAVMAQTQHVLLTYEGADRFARKIGLEQVPNDWFIIPERRRQLDEILGKDGEFDASIKYGTIGAVACDTSGNVAAATSTGGLTGKRWGRVGDSPLIGAGTYADNRSAAISGTGLGEAFIRAVAAHELAARMRLTGEALQAALDAVLKDITAVGGSGGLIAVSPTGEAAWGFTTPGMYRGRAGPVGRNVELYSEPERR
jgi:beta-aspartyl-peptidase (threonine type)